MGFGDFLRKLLHPRRGELTLPPYVSPRRTTRTGKLRATQTAINYSEKHRRIDAAALDAVELGSSAKKVYRYLFAVADEDGY